MDAWKLCQVCRRPEPRTAEDIGTWHVILEVMVFAAIVINAALVAFTGSFAVDEQWPADFLYEIDNILTDEYCDPICSALCVACL